MEHDHLLYLYGFSIGQPFTALHSNIEGLQEPSQQYTLGGSQITFSLNVQCVGDFTQLPLAHRYSSGGHTLILGHSVGEVTQCPLSHLPMKIFHNYQLVNIYKTGEANGQGLHRSKSKLQGMQLSYSQSFTLQISLILLPIYRFEIPAT